jgi:hypothetical protein
VADLADASVSKARYLAAASGPPLAESSIRKVERSRSLAAKFGSPPGIDPAFSVQDHVGHPLQACEGNPLPLF